MKPFIPKQYARGYIMPSFIMDNTKLCMGAKMLYGVLTDYARDKDYCYPSKSTLAHRLNCSLNSVKSWIAQLIEYGFLKIEISKKRSNIFYLLFPQAVFECVQKCQNLTAKVSNSDTESNAFKSKNIPPTPKQTFSHTHPCPAKNYNSSSKTRVGDFSNMNTNFEEFWNIYPKKEAKESARSLWHRFSRQGKLPSFGVLKDAITFFSESSSWSRENGRYVPYLASFIRGLRWKDVPQSPPKSSKAMPIINYEIESPFAQNKRILQEKQNLENKNKVTNNAFEMLKSFFKTPTKIDNCIAYGLFANLYDRGKIPLVQEKQEVNIVEFLKNYQVRT